MTDEEPTLDVVIRQGNRSRTVPPESLAAALRLPSVTIRTSLARLLFASFDPDTICDPAAPREPTEGVGNVGSETSVPNVSDPNKTWERRERNGGERGGLGERGESPLAAVGLAAALEDHAHLAALQALIAAYPADLVRAALTITLARPASNIRTTRGAYFTGVLRTLAARAGTPPHPHA